MPPLRERVDDVPLLVAHFADQIAATAGVPLRKFGEDAMTRLQQRPWPGNVRELRNGVERLMILSAGKMVTGPDVERLLPVFDAGSVGRSGGSGAPHVRDVQAGGGEELPAAEAPRS